MSITKANIITFVNSALRTSYSGTQLDLAIQACLNNLSNSNLLMEQADASALAANSLSIDYPTDFKELISIVLTDSSDVVYDPLEELPEGFEQYRILRAQDTGTGRPEYFAKHDKKFWLWRPSSGVYTPTIDYYRYHPQDLTTIMFGDEFTNAVYFGSAYFQAKLMARKEDEDNWLVQYLDEKAERESNMPSQPYIVRS